MIVQTRLVFETDRPYAINSSKNASSGSRAVILSKLRTMSPLYRHSQFVGGARQGSLQANAYLRLLGANRQRTVKVCFGIDRSHRVRQSLVVSTPRRLGMVFRTRFAALSHQHRADAVQAVLHLARMQRDVRQKEGVDCLRARTAFCAHAVASRVSRPRIIHKVARGEHRMQLLRVLHWLR